MKSIVLLSAPLMLLAGCAATNKDYVYLGIQTTAENAVKLEVLRGSEPEKARFRQASHCAGVINIIALELLIYMADTTSKRPLGLT